MKQIYKAEKECSNALFLNLFYSQHPFFVIKQFGGPPTNNSLVKRCKVLKLAAPLELFTAPKGSAARRLRITALMCLSIQVALVSVI